MHTYLMALGFDILKLVMISNMAPKTLAGTTRKKASENNEKAMNVILCRLLESKFFNVVHDELTK